MSTGLAFDQIGGSAASSAVIVRGERVASVPPRSISRSTASTPMPPPLVRMASRLPANGLNSSERGCRREQLVEIEHAKHAGAAERGVVDGVRTGQGPGVGSRRDGALRVAAGLDDHDRLDARGGARRRHELASVVDRLDVKQDGAGAAVDGEIVEQIAEIDIDLIAERDHRGEADRSLRRPFDEAGRDGSGLRDQRKVAALRHARCKAGVELDGRDDDPEAIGADEPQPVAAGGALGSLGERARTVAKARRDDNRGRDASGARCCDEARHLPRRRGNDNNIRYVGQVRDASDRRNAFNLVVARVDEVDPTGKTSRVQIASGSCGRPTLAAGLHR